MLYVVCKEIQSAENLGSIARSMENFGFSQLILINPKCNPTDFKAEVISKHAKQILKNAKIVSESFLKEFDYVVATTAILGTDYNIPRSPLNPKQLAEKIKEVDGYTTKKKIAILFGNEGTGLSNQDIKKSDFVVTIPANPDYPTMNISHACAILLYEIYLINDDEKSDSHIIAASAKEKEILMLKIYEIINKMGWGMPEKKHTQEIVWKRIINKAFLTKREIFALLGFFRKLNKK